MVTPPRAKPRPCFCLMLLMLLVDVGCCCCGCGCGCGYCCGCGCGCCCCWWWWWCWAFPWLSCVGGLCCRDSREGIRAQLGTRWIPLAWVACHSTPCIRVPRAIEPAAFPEHRTIIISSKDPNPAWNRLGPHDSSVHSFGVASLPQHPAYASMPLHRLHRTAC